MKKKFFLSFAILCISTLSFAQHQADKWYFGNTAGLDFTSGSPTAITSSAMTAGEGSASISDPTTGNLLFYTDGINVYNANNTVMLNGTGLNGGMSSTQPAVIVQDPGNSNKYYIFTTDETGNSLGLRYSVVDMLSDAGNGDVVLKNTLLIAPVAEKVAAVRQPESDEYWILAHGWNDDAFYAYEVTVTGISAPIISHTGIVHSDAVIQNSYGQMKFNSCGDKLALAIGYMDTVQIFDFDVATGVVSNPQTIPYADHVYGIEFSQDNNVLYVSTYDLNGTLMQYNLNEPSTSAMIASAQVISTTPSIYPLQRGPDDKIYVVRSYAQYVGVIQSPNSIGSLACDYIENGIDLDLNSMGVNSGIGLPNFVSSFTGDISNCGNGSAGINNNKLSELNVYPNPSIESFTIQTQASDAEIIVTDASGKLVEKFRVQVGTTFNFGKNYVSGVYFVSTTNESGRSTLKIVKTE